MDFERFERDYRPALYRYCMRRLCHGDVETAEDVVQETLIRAFRAFDRRDNSKNPLSWLISIAIRIHLDELRKAKCRPSTCSYDAGTLSILEDSYEFPETGETLEERTIQRLDALGMLGQLSPRRQQAVLLHALGFTVVEAAAEAGVPESTVKTWLHRARRRANALAA